MSVNDIGIKKRAEMAATLLICAPVLKVPQAMRAAKFTLEQSQNAALQQRVRRIWKEKLNRQKETTPVERVVLIRSTRSPLSGLTLVSTPTSSSEPSDTTASDEVIPLPELEMYRSTVTTAMKIAANKRVMKKYKDEALKAATKLYQDEQQKENGMSAMEVERRIKKRYSGEGPCARMIMRYINQYRLVDSSPLKVGKPSEIPDHAFESLCVGLESYISIIQNNKLNHKLEKKKLMALVNSVVGRELTDKHKSYKLLSRIAKCNKIDLNAIKLSTQEARRIQWTKRKYLQIWFNTWEANLIKLGFAKRSEVDGKLEIPDDQLARILNFDETCL